MRSLCWGLKTSRGVPPLIVFNIVNQLYISTYNYLTSFLFEEIGCALFPIVKLVPLIRPGVWEMVNKCWLNEWTGKTNKPKGSGKHMLRDLTDQKKHNKILMRNIYGTRGNQRFPWPVGIYPRKNGYHVTIKLIKLVRGTVDKKALGMLSSWIAY